jgi:GNAT superfamily N-acetyltransferase
MIEPCGPERAEEVHRLTQAAFRRHARLDPPSGAARESVEHVRADLAAGGGAILTLEGEPVGCLRFAPTGDDLHVRRVAIDPRFRRRGLGRALMAWAEQEAARRGCDGITVGVRIALPGNLAFFRGLGYDVVGEGRHDGYEQTTWFDLRKRLGADESA